MSSVSVYPAIGGTSIQNVTQIVRADNPVTSVQQAEDGAVIVCPVCDVLVLTAASALAQVTVELPLPELDGRLLTITTTKDVFQLTVKPTDDLTPAFSDTAFESSSIRLVATLAAGWVRI